MGMYLNTLTYETKQIKPEGDDSDVILNKTLKFIVPFKKNKSIYSQTDIKPVYDSLRLTDFNIKSIKINAYASIEGISERNKELQQERAKGVLAALQSFQKPTIKTTVSSSENWVEFFNDIEGTKYEFLKSLTKDEVRKTIAGKLRKEMEPIFSNHRKAVLELELEKKDRFAANSVGDLLTKFNVLIAQKDFEKSEITYDEAKEIQNSIFEKLRGKEDALDFLKQMSVPRQLRFIQLLINNAAFMYMEDFKYATMVYNELLDLEKMDPNNGEIKYNLVAIKLKLWFYNALVVDETNLNNEIYALRKYDIPKQLIEKMLVNFHIVITRKFIEQGDYTNKDKSVEYVNNNVKKFDLLNSDYLNLAQFFNDFGDVKMAIDLLEKKVRRIDVDENLLFYYLNFTLINKDLTSTKTYRTVMLNAINMNKKRFCKLFNSVEKGGVTFQILEDEYLRKTYCENCND
jgi:tetratricopeptide (TPR) repeat protein